MQFHIQFKQLHKHCLFEILCSVQTHTRTLHVCIHKDIRTHCMPDVQLTKQLFEDYITSAGSLIFHFWFRHIIIWILINIACVHAFLWWSFWCWSGPRSKYFDTLDLELHLTPILNTLNSAFFWGFLLICSLILKFRNHSNLLRLIDSFGIFKHP